jgi:cysteine desulfurase
MIYLDYQATTPLAPEARAAMLPWLGGPGEAGYGNPHSPHRAGREARAAVEHARDRIAAAFAGEPGQLLFTSGATEAANMVIQGVGSEGGRQSPRIVTLATEHSCVLDPIRWLGARGVETEILPVGPEGLVDLDRARSAIGDRCTLVCAMLVNNEIGVVQPIAELAALAHAAGARFFCDAVQGFGRVPLPVAACDYVALSAHKLHGPKGIGALWVRDSAPLSPLLHGGGQEAGLRSGTLAPMLCAGFGAAATLMAEREAADHAHVEALWTAALAGFGPAWTLNGEAGRRYRGNLSLRREGVDAARLIADVRQVAFSAGSACTSGSGRPSHVLAALGLSDRQARGTIRLGFGRYTMEAEIAEAAALLNAAAERQSLWA